MVERVFILIPAFNAGSTLEGVFARIPPEAERRITRYIAVNDGSADDTADVLHRLARGQPKLQVVHHPENAGYGATQREMLADALAQGAEAAIVLHADGQYPPEQLPEIVAVFDRREADLVQGSRILGGGALRGGMPLYKYLGNRALTALENAAFGLRLAEYHSGYMSYSRHFLETVPFDRLSDSFDYDLEMIVLARIHQLRIREIPIPTRYAGETSHLNPVTYGLRCLRAILRYRTGYYHRLAGR